MTPSPTLLFVGYLGVMVVGCIIAIAIASVVSRGNRVIRNVTGLLFAAGGSYAAGFLVDMLISSWAGEIPSANVVPPSFTWLTIAFVATVAALVTALALGIPFGLNAALALAAALLRPRHAIVGFVLLGLASLVVVVRRRSDGQQLSVGQIVRRSPIRS